MRFQGTGGRPSGGASLPIPRQPIRIRGRGPYARQREVRSPFGTQAERDERARIDKEERANVARSASRRRESEPARDEQTPTARIYGRPFDESEALRLLAQGRLNRVAIARELHTSEERLRAFAKAHGYGGKPSAPSARMTYAPPEMIADYRGGASVNALSRAYGHSPKTIRKQLIRAGEIKEEAPQWQTPQNRT